jgi:hypothetical protein
VFSGAAVDPWVLPLASDHVSGFRDVTAPSPANVKTAVKHSHAAMGAVDRAEYSTVLVGTLPRFFLAGPCESVLAGARQRLTHDPVTPHFNMRTAKAGVGELHGHEKDWESSISGSGIDDSSLFPCTETCACGACRA